MIDLLNKQDITKIKGTEFGTSDRMLYGKS